MKSQTKPTKSSNDSAYSSGSRSAADTGTKKASGGHEKASASKAGSKRSAMGGEKKSTPSSK